MKMGIISGQLLGIEEFKLSLETSAGVRVLPRRDLEVSVEWTLEHMGRPVFCRLEDDVVVEIAAVGR